MLLVLMVLVPLWATTPILWVVISALADGSLGYNDQSWWRLSCIFLNYAFGEWKPDTRRNKLSFVIANQMCINNRVHPLCFVDILHQICKRNSRQPHLFGSPLPSIVWSQWRGQRQRYTKYTLEEAECPFECGHCCGLLTVQPVSLIRKHLSLTWWW